MNWFYWKAHHGLPYDTKIALIAKRLDIHRTRVLAVWIACLDYASQCEDRGSIGGIDACEIALGLDIPTPEVEHIMEAFRMRGMIANDAIYAWEKRNEKSEDRTGAIRQKRFRERRKAQSNGSNGVTERDSNGESIVTVTDALRDSNAEERRGEEKRVKAAAAVTGVTVTNQQEAPPPTAAALKTRIREISKPPSKADHHRALSEYAAIREWLVSFPGAQRLPGKPDDEIVKRCLDVAGGDIAKAASALKAMNRDGKRPNLSWAYFPTVMQQYLGVSA